jgi:glycerophosphoryl diester phosphodiesterase
MSGMKKKLFAITVIAVVMGLFLFFNNSSYLTTPASGKPWLLAHRGLGQTFPMQGLTGETNTAARIFPPEHPYLENTIQSMEAAFLAGADVVELDIHPTTDGQFAVFHDWTLDHRTDGTGVTRDHAMTELRTLDVGFGYTADQGKTFPFRGKGVGLMPTLDEVLKHFPKKRFLVHIKSNDTREGELLAELLKKLPEKRLDQIWVYGGEKPIASLKAKLPGLRVLSKATVKKALLEYLAIGWTGIVPSSLKDSLLVVPLKYASFLWGWPNLFQKRMVEARTPFAVVGGKGNWSEGFDTLDSLKLLPASFTGGIWTNRIDLIGSELGKR